MGSAWLRFGMITLCLVIGCGGGSGEETADPSAGDGAAAMGPDDGTGGGPRRGGTGAGTIESPDAGPLADGAAGDAARTDGPAADAPARLDGAGDGKTTDAPLLADVAARDGALGDVPLCGMGSTCAALEQSYNEALARAQSCNPLLANTCQAKRPGAIACGCQVWVNRIDQLDPLLDEWQAKGCNTCKVCTRLQVACRVLTAGTCNASKLTAIQPAEAATPISDPGPIVVRQGTCADKPAL